MRNSSRPKKPLLRDVMSSGRFGRNADTRCAESSPVEYNGSKTLEMQLRLQSQQEELTQMQQERAKLKEELLGQKVQLSLCRYFTKYDCLSNTDVHRCHKIGSPFQVFIITLTAPSLVKNSVYIYKSPTNEMLCIEYRRLYVVRWK